MVETENHVFIQKFLQCRMLTQEQVELLVNDLGKKSVEQYFQDVNQSLHQLDFEIRQVRDQLTGDKQWVFINTVADEIIQNATVFTQSQLEFFKTLLQAMLASQEDQVISSTEALNLTTSVSKQEAQELIKAFANYGWLIIQSNGLIILSSRALAELQTHMIEMFGSEEEEGGVVRFCRSCKDIVIVGIHCECGAHIHKHCANHLPRCPGCDRSFQTKLLPSK